MKIRVDLKKSSNTGKILKRFSVSGFIGDLFGRDFSGCYKPTPPKRNLILEIRLVPKEMGKLLLQCVLAFPSSFCYTMSTPLHSAHPYFRVSCPFGDSVQDFDRYFLIL